VLRIDVISKARRRAQLWHSIAASHAFVPGFLPFDDPLESNENMTQYVEEAIQSTADFQGER
jgi:hypothetical protein